MLSSQRIHQKWRMFMWKLFSAIFIKGFENWDNSEPGEGKIVCYNDILFYFKMMWWLWRRCGGSQGDVVAEWLYAQCTPYTAKTSWPSLNPASIAQWDTNPWGLAAGHCNNLWIESHRCTHKKIFWVYYLDYKNILCPLLYFPKNIVSTCLYSVFCIVIWMYPHYC